MTKRGTLKPVDQEESRIRSNAKYYTVVGFSPGNGRKIYNTFDTLVFAKAYCKELVNHTGLRLRAVMVYAVDEYERNALVGTMGQDSVWKEAVEKRYA
jgi:hypothetical protein